MIYSLPTSVTIKDMEYSVRTDFRAILDICTALTDPNLDQSEKAVVMLEIFYESPDDIPEEDLQDALKECVKFINLGAEESDKNRKAPKLMDWEQDFQYIVAPINKVLGTEIRSLEYLHWWTFIAAYYEIGDCTFAQIVRIRDMKAKGKQLDKFDKEWYRDHSDIVDLKTTYSDAEKELFKSWGV